MCGFQFFGPFPCTNEIKLFVISRITSKGKKTLPTKDFIREYIKTFNFIHTKLFHIISDLIA